MRKRRRVEKVSAVDVKMMLGINRPRTVKVVPSSRLAQVTSTAFFLLWSWHTWISSSYRESGEAKRWEAAYHPQAFFVHSIAVHVEALLTGFRVVLS